MSNSQRRYLAICVELAKLSRVRRARHGAILVSSGRILSVGVNTPRNRPRSLGDLSEFNGRFCTVHAEEACLRQWGRRVPKRATLYVARVNMANEIKNSTPCPRCQELIKLCDIRKVITT